MSFIVTVACIVVADLALFGAWCLAAGVNAVIARREAEAKAALDKARADAALMTADAIAAKSAMAEIVKNILSATIGHAPGCVSLTPARG